MNQFDEPSVTLDEPVKPRSAASRLGDLGDRLARRFATLDRTSTEVASPDSNGDAADPVVVDTAPVWEPVAPRFPIARRGYDRGAVDQRVTGLERELCDLRAHIPSAVAAEIERVGEQTAAILRAAHEQAQETTHRAQAQADSCLANAASNAIAITEDATRQLHQLDGDTDSVWRERARLIEDVRNVATALLSLAEDAADRFPPEPVGHPAPVVAGPTRKTSIGPQTFEPEDT